MNILRLIKFSKSVNSTRIFAIALFLFAQLGLSSVVNAQTQTEGNKDNAASSNVLMLSKMTSKQRDKITNPAEGMVIYNTDEKKPQYYNGTAWKFFDSNKHFIGEEYGGGIIFYIDGTGEHGLIVAPSDQPSAKWGFFEKQIGAHGKAIGEGQANTDKITKASTQPDIAANICNDLRLNGLSDWFLPSIDELSLIYKNLKAKGLGNFSSGEYWSSSETDFNNAWFMNFNVGLPSESNVDKSLQVRAVRKF